MSPKRFQNLASETTRWRQDAPESDPKQGNPRPGGFRSSQARFKIHARLLRPPDCQTGAFARLVRLGKITNLDQIGNIIRLMLCCSGHICKRSRCQDQKTAKSNESLIGIHDVEHPHPQQGNHTLQYNGILRW